MNEMVWELETDPKILQEAWETGVLDPLLSDEDIKEYEGPFTRRAEYDPTRAHKLIKLSNGTPAIVVETRPGYAVIRPMAELRSHGNKPAE